MPLLKELSALPFDWGGQVHSGWLPKGAATPLPVPPEPDLLDVQIHEESGAYLVLWTGRRTGRSGDTWHETLEQAEEAGWRNFDILKSHWAHPCIRRAVERSFGGPSTQDIMDALCTLRSSGSERARAAILVLADGNREKLEALIRLYKEDSRDLHAKFAWRTHFEKDALPPEQWTRRYQALGLPVPERFE